MYRFYLWLGRQKNHSVQLHEDSRTQLVLAILSLRSRIAWIQIGLMIESRMMMMSTRMLLVYCGDSCWTANRQWKKWEAPESTKGSHLMTSYKRACSLSFDEQVLSDSEMPMAKGLTLEGTNGRWVEWTDMGTWRWRWSIVWGEWSLLTSQVSNWPI